MASVPNDQVIIQFTADDKLSPAAKQMVAALQAVEQETGKADAQLVRLGMSTIVANNSMSSVAKEATNATNEVMRLANEAKKSAAGVELMTRAQEALNQEITKGMQGTDYDRLQELADAYDLASKGAEAYQQKLAALPSGAMALSQQLQALGKTNTAISDYVRQGQSALRGTEAYERAVSKMTVELIKMADAGKQNTVEFAQMQQAISLGNTQLESYRQTLSKLPEGTDKLSHALRTDLKTAGDIALKTLQSIGLGISSSVFSFSLLAGGIVAIGHLIGNAYVKAAADADKLRKSVQDLSALNPRLNTDDLFQQITDMEIRIATLSEKLVGVYKYGAPLAGGNEQQALDITEQLAAGAQGSRQNPTAWAEAATGTLKAYNLEVEDLARVQDVLTVAMQNSQGGAENLLKLWSSVSKAASNASTPLEQNAAAMVVLAQNGGDLEENLRALKGTYDALSTENVRQQLHLMGVATEDLNGETLPLIDTLRQLHDRLGSLPSGDRDSKIASLFQDRDVRNVVKTLMDSYDELIEKTDMFANTAGAAEAAHLDYLDSAAGKLDRNAALQQAVNEKVGDFLNLTKHFTDFIIDLEDMNIKTYIGQERWNQYSKAQQEAIRNFANMAAGRPIGFGITEEDIAKLKEQVEQIGKLEVAQRQHEAIAAQSVITNNQNTAAGHNTAAAIDEQTKSLIAVNEQYRTFANWSGRVVQDSSYLIPSLQGVSKAVNDVYQESERLTQGNKFGGFASEAEQKMAEVTQQLQESNTELRYLQSLTVPDDSMLGRFLSGVLAQKIAEATERTKELQKAAEDAARDIQRDSPQAKAAQENFGQFVTQQGWNATNAANQANLDAVTNASATAIDNLRDAQDKLQRALRDDSTPELAEARKQLEDATKNLTDETERYNDALYDLNEQMYQNETAMKIAMAQPTADLKTAKDALSEASEKAEQDLYDMNSKLQDLQDTLKKTKEASKGYLDPFVNSVNEAKAALQNLQAEVQQQDTLFDKAAFSLQTQSNILDDLARKNLNPLIEQIQKYKNELEDADRAMNKELRPYEDALYGQSEAVRAAQDELKSIAQVYEKELNPLVEEYNRLQREKQKQEEQDRLHQGQLGIENLVARLAQAKAGTSDYITLQQQLARAKNDQDRDVRMAELKDKISGLEDQRDEDTAAAKERVAAAQAEYEQTKRQIEEIKRRYEIETRATRDLLADKEYEYGRSKQHYDEEKAKLDERKRQLDEVRRIYDFYAQQKIVAAQADVTEAEASLTRAQGFAKALEDMAQADVTAQETVIKNYTRTSTENLRTLKQNVKDAQGAYDDLKGYYDGINEGISEKIRLTQHDATEFGRLAGEQVKTAQTKYKELRQEYQDNIDRIGDQIIATQNTAKEAEEAARRVIAAERDKQEAIKNTWAWINAVNNATKNGAVIPPGTLPPGVKDPSNPKPPKPGGKSDPPGGKQGHGSTSLDDYSFNSINFGMPDSESPVPTTVADNAGFGGIGTVIINMGGISNLPLGNGDPTKEDYWYGVGEAMLGGMQTVLNQKHGVKIEIKR